MTCLMFLGITFTIGIHTCNYIHRTALFGFCDDHYKSIPRGDFLSIEVFHSFLNILDNNGILAYIY